LSDDLQSVNQLIIDRVIVLRVPVILHALAWHFLRKRKWREKWERFFHLLSRPVNDEKRIVVHNHRLDHLKKI
jgi:hypothetical protein